MKDKILPILHIDDFKADRPAPDVYVQKFREHVAQYPFTETPHRHDFYMLALFTHGTGVHSIDFVEYPIQPDSVFFMSPSQVHTWTYSDDTDGYLFFFDAAFYLVEFPARRLFDSPLFHSLAASPVVQLPAEASADIKGLFVRIYEETISASYHREDVIRSYLNILLVKLSGLVHTFKSTQLSPYALSQIQQLELLIEKHYLDHKNVEDYASMMALSVKQMYTLCQRALGKSPKKIIQERLLLEAKRLLVHTNQSVGQVADRLNFLDHSYFNRFFRNAIGETPENFRSRYQ